MGKEITPNAYLFADGSSSRSEDIGAWASIAINGARRKLLYGAVYPTTISRCELLPIIEGLRWIKANWTFGPGFVVAVYSDSEYTIKTLSGLCPRNKNTELWAAVDDAAKDMRVLYHWKERNVLHYMELCDAVCGAVRKSMIKSATEWWQEPRAPELRLPMCSVPSDHERTEG